MQTIVRSRMPGSAAKIGVHIGFIDNVLIDFVRNDEGIEFLHDFCNLEEFLTGEYLARRVRRIAEK